MRARQEEQKVLLLLLILIPQVALGIIHQQGGLSPTDKDCPFGTFGPQPGPCICLEGGLWSVLGDYCSTPMALQGVAKGTTYCIPNNFPQKVQMLGRILTFNYPEVAQISTSLHKVLDRFDNFSKSVPFPADIHQGPSTLVTYGGILHPNTLITLYKSIPSTASEWTLRTDDDDKAFCLIHDASPSTHFCLFQGLNMRVERIVEGCDTAPRLPPTKCFPLQLVDRGCEDALAASSSNSTASSLLSTAAASEIENLSSDDLYQLYKMFLGEDEEEVSKVGRRQLSEEDGGAGAGGGLLSLDEDEVVASASSREIGHKLMREQIDQYVDTVIASLTGLDDGGAAAAPQKRRSYTRYPALKILSLLKSIMVRTCPAVKSEFFELALNSFLKVQLESFHVKEPYMGHPLYVRVAHALRTCLKGARAHIFPRNNSECSGKDAALSPGPLVALEPTPIYAKASLEDGIAVREPLIETVWKMVVNGHSYCYPHFKAYFNDHHSLTVTLLPLFNNAIQDIWLKEGGYPVGEEGGSRNLYGGMLGDVRKILEDVDNCVAASRQLSNYPWYMSRPLRDQGNKWRKKRDAEGGLYAPTPLYINGGNTLCLFDPDDPVAFLGKPNCSP